jgi:hypothetical protein
MLTPAWTKKIYSLLVEVGVDPHGMDISSFSFLHQEKGELPTLGLVRCSSVAQPLTTLQFPNWETCMEENICSVKARGCAVLAA